MVFAAVPNDITIEKLTAPEKRALDEYLGKDTRKSILERLASNEKIPSLIAGGVILASVPTILRLIFDALNKQNGFDLKEEAVDYLTFQKDLLEGFFELTGAGKFAGDPFKGEAKDFWDKYVKR